ncbi:hypothetical protein BKA70DRAFT_1454125 [Coprinopsis sp. MPI-PUGE-AT-0042]|nr:hypothetical protein BKA70DRAFT_1454125 [Coprinopsis sp. MPI-PUGE-AT-0042]
MTSGRLNAWLCFKRPPGFCHASVHSRSPPSFSWEPGHVTRSDGHSVRRPFFLLRRRHQPLTTSPPLTCRHLACTVGISQQRPFVTPPSAPSSSPPLPSSPPPSLVVVVVVVAACHRPLPPPSPASPTAAHRLHRRLLQPPSPSPSAVASPPPPPSTTLLPPPPSPSTNPHPPPSLCPLRAPSIEPVLSIGDPRQQVHPAPSPQRRARTVLPAQPLPRHTSGHVPSPLATSRHHPPPPVTTTSSPSTPHHSFDTKTARRTATSPVRTDHRRMRQPPRQRYARTNDQRDNATFDCAHGPSPPPRDRHVNDVHGPLSRDANDVQGPFPLRQRRARTLPATSQPLQRALTLRATPT